MLTIFHLGHSDQSNWLSITELHGGGGVDHLSIFKMYVQEVSLWWVAVGRPGTAESWQGLGKMLHVRTRLVSPTVLLCGAKCSSGMSQESGCSPSATSHAGVTLSWEVTRDGFCFPGDREWLSGVGVPSARCQGAVSALSSAMALVWRPEEVLPCCPPFLVIHTGCRWLYLSGAPNTVHSWYLGLSSSPEMHPHFHTEELKG